MNQWAVDSNRIKSLLKNRKKLSSNRLFYSIIANILFDSLRQKQKKEKTKQWQAIALGNNENKFIESDEKKRQISD